MLHLLMLVDGQGHPPARDQHSHTQDEPDRQDRAQSRQRVPWGARRKHVVKGACVRQVLLDQPDSDLIVVIAESCLSGIDRRVEGLARA
jgi:hypothetical protein